MSRWLLLHAEASRLLWVAPQKFVPFPCSKREVGNFTSMLVICPTPPRILAMLGHFPPALHVPYGTFMTPAQAELSYRSHKGPQYWALKLLPCVFRTNCVWLEAKTLDSLSVPGRCVVWGFIFYRTQLVCRCILESHVCYG